MRALPTLAASAAVLLLTAGAPAAELRHFDDAALYAVQFADAEGREGWAVGDEGVIWHTIDGGRNWERQPSGVRASLRSVCFLNPYVGWVAGREELTGGGSAGVLLYTKDGGLHWRRLLVNALPGLHRVCFPDEKTGYLAGEGSDAYPSGLFATHDGGRTWQPVAGPRCPAWWAADFTGPGDGALAGAWNRQATLRRDKLYMVDSDILGGRTLRGLALRDGGGIAVGEGGLVLQSDGSRGSTWNFADLRLPPHVAENWDFHALGGVGRHWWVVGRPGSVALHSPDRGRTWELVRTGQPMPLHGITFVDEQHGWAVGELGTVVATTNAGKTWRVQHRGGQRAAVLLVHARAAGTPLDAVALLGGQEGYLAAALRVTAPDPVSAAPGRASDGPRYAEAIRQAGGAAGEALWQFPVPSHLTPAGRNDLVRAWDQLHGDKAAEQLLRQLVLAVRTWQPDVILTDGPGGCGCDGLIAEAVHEGFERAADPHAFPEQLSALGLTPWKASKLYAVVEDDRAASVTLDLGQVCPSLEDTLKEFVSAPAALLAEKPTTLPMRRGFRLVAAHIDGAAGHRDLMQGVEAAPGGLARRPVTATPEPSAEQVKAIRQRARILTLAEAPADRLAGPERLLAHVGPLLAELPDDQAARAAHAIAWQYVRRGQWTLARETFGLLAERYPAHPLALDACRWLVRHNSSSEARRRSELGQFVIVQELQYSEITPAEKPAGDGMVQAAVGAPPKKDPKKPQLPEVPRVEMRRQTAGGAYTPRGLARQWYASSLELEGRLAAFGPQAAADPSVQFCLQSARRNLGDYEGALKWYGQFAARQPDGPWRSAALAELWLAQRVGTPPKPVLSCRHTDVRPHLDGRLDDECWQKAQAVRLQNAVGDTLAEYPTAVRLAYDHDFLYLAVQCKHPTDRYVPTVASRGRDADLRGHDRVSVLLDLDRDYCTCYHLEIDQRGCVYDDCWGDHTWDPRWFVAVHGTPEGWVAEAAIPMGAMSGDSVTPGKAWACNIVRVLPGRGVQAFSLPADVPEEALRPEGMGLLMFQQEPRRDPGVVPAAATRERP
jgi:photosystem II stability/assembly factor-like uncharacterized protein